MDLCSSEQLSASAPRMAIVLSLSILSLVSCGPSPQAGGGIGGTGSTSVSSVSSGRVTKLSSVVVSGTEYDDANATYCIDDEPCNKENSLKVGMVVLVKGMANLSGQNTVTRTASTIIYEDTVDGVVQSIAQDASSLIVLGQFVDLSPKTVIDPSIPGRSIRNLTPGLDVVQVSGLVASDGHILASLITKRTGKAHYEVEGIIKHHDVQRKRFEIGQLMVDYSSANISDLAVNETTNWDGTLIHVQGNDWQLRNEVSFGAKLMATRVKPLGLTVADSDEAKLEGVISDLRKPGFVINNHPIEVSAGTTFDGGTADDLTLGAHVSIHGTLVGGVLEAQEVVFKENVEMESNVESIDIQTGTLSLVGFRSLPIARDTQTVIKNEGTPSHFEDLRIGDHVKVHARLLDGRQLVATELERTIPSTSVVLQAPLQLAANPHLVLLGTSLDTSEIADNEFLGLYGPIGRMTFFDKAVVGLPVRVKGIVADSVVTWHSVGINR